MIKACIFDLDGTLIDTLEDIAGFVNPILRRHGWPEHPVDAYRYLVGQGFRKLLERAVPAGNGIDIEALYRESLADYQKTGEQSGKPYAGVRQCLERLAAQNIPLAVISNKPDSITRAVVRATFPEIKFALVQGAIEGQPVKPHPGGALRAAAAASCSPADCAFIGDSNVDMATAKAAGMLAVGAAWGFRGREELAEAGADYILDSIGQLTDLLAGQFSGQFVNAQV